MSAGSLKLEVRAAIAGHVLQQWNVDCSPDHGLDSRRYQLILKDISVLADVESNLLAPGYTP